MSSQRYERIFSQDEDNLPQTPQSDINTYDHGANIPGSPPPSFRSRASSIGPQRGTSDQEQERLVDRTLADTFDSPSDSDSDDETHHQLDDRQRVMSGRPVQTDDESGTRTPTDDPRPGVERRVTQLPVFNPSSPGRGMGGGTSVNDGVFANLSAKPERGDEVDEKPPTYEQAAADATPPYWETTILAPGATSDEVFIDGLPVGSLFSFVWNGMISMSFQLVGFLLTYLLHTTHAAKNGSKAGLGITLVQYGFSMKGSFSKTPSPSSGEGTGDGEGFVQPPSDPNSHNFDPNNPTGSPGQFDQDGDVPDGFGAMRATDWFAYALMIVGWFILIRSVSEYIKARRHEQLVLQSPSRGLNVPVVSDDERPEGAV